MITQETANQLHPTKQVYVRAWWYKDKRAVLCEVVSTYKGNVGKNKYSFSWGTKYNEEDITHVTVLPLEGNRHHRFISVSEIIS